jgi:cytochrome c oxidase subunit 4
MSSDAHAHDAHGAGGDHVPHVLPLVDYFKTYGALLVLTVITVGASYVNLGTTLNLILAMLIATIKASVVAAIFMHLFWDQKFFAVIFSSTILFLAIFMAFTMFDTEARGVADPLEALKPANWKQPFGGTTEDELIKKAVEADKKYAAEAAGMYGAEVVVPAPAGAAPTPGAAAPAGQPANTGAPALEAVPGGAPPTAPAQPEGKEAPPAPAGDAPKAPPAPAAPAPAPPQ